MRSHRRLDAVHAIVLAMMLSMTGVLTAADCDETSVGRTPINDLGSDLYLGQFEGGLYFGGNVVPAAHRQEGAARAHAITPLDTSGAPDPAGKIVLLSIGMSNTKQEFDVFITRAAEHPLVDDESLAILNGARSGQTAPEWVDPEDGNYNRIRDDVLAPLGLTEAQVQVAWVKLANKQPMVSLPDPNADAFAMLSQLGEIMRTLRLRYPNLKIVFLASRIYAGYAITPLNPEPYAYESGFAAKWLIEAQITQHTSGEIDPLAGDLSYDGATGVAPWIVWGTYLWADGLTPRSDGLIWECSDFNDDGTHPSDTGRQKVAMLLMNHFLNSPFSRPWFRADGPTAGDFNNDGVVDEDDRALFCQTLGTAQGEQGYHPSADLNNDGVIGELDQAIFNEILSPCIGDVVDAQTLQPPADGVTNGADLAFLLGEWGSEPSCADFVTSSTFAPTPDGIVDGADLASLLGGWGPCE